MMSIFTNPNCGNTCYGGCFPQCQDHSHHIPLIRMYIGSRGVKLQVFFFHMNFSMTLDTPGNRKGMPDADHTQWTPLEYVAK